MEKEVGSNNPVATAAAGWANWAVGAVTSKFYKSRYESILAVVTSILRELSIYRKDTRMYTTRMKENRQILF